MIDIKIQIEELGLVEGKLPENWDEITVGDYEKIFENNLTDLDQLSQYIFILSQLTNIPKDILMEVPIEDFKNLLNKIQFINSDIPSYDCDFIDIEDNRYYLYNDFTQLTAGEVITIDTLITQNNNNFNKIISDLLCVFLRKKKDNGKFEKFNTNFFERKDDFKKLPIIKVYHLLTFFLNFKN
ncbi:MAG: hypothetical protein EBR82_32395 [Caulobacteraceae bacterium]|nr:hypothetical protein [Caulobacteraceae bacterium]